MPYSPKHKQDTRERILESSRRLFNRKGFSEVSIEEIMTHAGLTHGGFYRHFKGKDEVYAEAVRYFLCKKAPELRLKRLSLDELSSEWRAEYRYERSIMSAAESGIQFLVESSCVDNAARGRASRRESDLLSAIKRIESARQGMVREADARRQESKPTPTKKQRKRTE